MIKPGQLLFTRDGRLHGNAIVVTLIGVSVEADKWSDLWEVEFEHGNRKSLTMFEIVSEWFTEDANQSEHFMEPAQWTARCGRGDGALRLHLEAIREALGPFYTVQQDEVAAVKHLREAVVAHKRSKEHVEQEAARMSKDNATLRTVNKSLVQEYVNLSVEHGRMTELADSDCLTLLKIYTEHFGGIEPR